MELHISKNPDLLSHEMADWITNDIKTTLRKTDRYTLALSGGNTPKSLYHLLTQTPYKEKINWSKIHIFFGDERYVPFEDDRNNGKMANDILLRYVPIPEKQIHFMNTTFPPDQSAREYSKILHRYFERTTNTFDLVLLGMGDDGHTLSLFPGTSVIHEDKKWVKAFLVEKLNMYRITITVPVVERSAAIAFLVEGEKKAVTLKQVMEGKFNPDRFPSQIIKPLNGNLHWFIDESAASQLKQA